MRGLREFFTAALLLLPALCFSLEVVDEDHEDYLKALEFYEIRYYEKAVEHLMDYIEDYPTDIAANEFLEELYEKFYTFQLVYFEGKELYNSGLYSNAIQKFDEALELGNGEKIQYYKTEAEDFIFEIENSFFDSTAEESGESFSVSWQSDLTNAVFTNASVYVVTHENLLMLGVLSYFNENDIPLPNLNDFLPDFELLKSFEVTGNFFETSISDETESALMICYPHTPDGVRSQPILKLFVRENSVENQIFLLEKISQINPLPFFTNTVSQDSFQPTFTNLLSTNLLPVTELQSSNPMPEIIPFSKTGKKRNYWWLLFLLLIYPARKTWLYFEKTPKEDRSFKGFFDFIKSEIRKDFTLILHFLRDILEKRKDLWKKTGSVFHSFWRKLKLPKFFTQTLAFFRKLKKKIFLLFCLLLFGSLFAADFSEIFADELSPQLLLYLEENYASCAEEIRDYSEIRDFYLFEYSGSEAVYVEADALISQITENLRDSSGIYLKKYDYFSYALFSFIVYYIDKDFAFFSEVLFELKDSTRQTVANSLWEDAQEKADDGKYLMAVIECSGYMPLAGSSVDKDAFSWLMQLSDLHIERFSRYESLLLNERIDEGLAEPGRDSLFKGAWVYAEMQSFSENFELSDEQILLQSEVLSKIELSYRITLYNELIAGAEKSFTCGDFALTEECYDYARLMLDYPPNSESILSNLNWLTEVKRGKNTVNVIQTNQSLLEMPLP